MRDTLPVITAISRFQEALTRVKITRDKRPQERAMEREVRRMFRAQYRALARQMMPKAKALFENYLLPEASAAPWMKESDYRAAVLFREAASASTINRLLTQIISADETTWQDTLAGQIGEAIARGARRQAAELSASFDVPTERIEALASQQAVELLTGVNETTRATVREIIAEGIRDRRTYQQVARDLAARFDEFSRSRARVIAITEIGNAYVRGQQQTDRGLIDAGIAMEKAWLPTDPCPVCEENAAAGYIDYGAEFPSGHDAPTAHPSCKCALLSRRKE